MLVRTDGSGWGSPEVTAYDNEAHLQQILADQPGWIPGVDDSAFTAQELSTTAGPIDVCVVGGNGGLTVVECKLASNSEKRRMVVGQVIDYASAIWMEGPDVLLQKWEARTGQSLQDTLSDTSLEQLRKNIEIPRIDLCLAVDSIDADLRRLVEYLNMATRSDVRVTAVQLAYARQGEVEILVPSTYGGEIAESKVRAAGRSAEDWTVEGFVDALGTDEDRDLARRLIDLVVSGVGPSAAEPLVFGHRPGGVIQLRPGGVRYSPAGIWVNTKRQLTICGTWTNYPGLLHHAAFERLATFLAGVSWLSGFVMAARV